MPNMHLHSVDLALIVETRCRECRRPDYRAGRLTEVAGGEVRATATRWYAEPANCPGCGSVATVLPDPTGGRRVRATGLRLRVGDRVVEVGGLKRGAEPGA